MRQIKSIAMHENGVFIEFVHVPGDIRKGGMYQRGLFIPETAVPDEIQEFEAAAERFLDAGVRAYEDSEVVDLDSPAMMEDEVSPWDNPQERDLNQVPPPPPDLPEASAWMEKE